MKFDTSLFCEIDKYAAESYSAIHNVNPNLNIGDITKVDEKDVSDFNVMFGGSPCQDFSVAGKLNGAVWTCSDCRHTYNPLEVHYSKRALCPKCNSDNIEKTRSSLIVEWLRFLREKKPRFAIYENVKNITEKRFMPIFQLFLNELDEYGYNVYWDVLNAKDYGVPQNRERVYCIIIRKDLDNGEFRFPKPRGTNVKLSDILETEVDSKYYLNEEKVRQLFSSERFSKSLDKLKAENRGKLINTGIKLKDAGGEFCGYSDNSYAVLSRDYKGLTKWQTVGVIHIEN